MAGIPGINRPVRCVFVGEFMQCDAVVILAEGNPCPAKELFRSVQHSKAKIATTLRRSREALPPAHHKEKPRSRNY